MLVKSTSLTLVNLICGIPPHFTFSPFDVSEILRHRHLSGQFVTLVSINQTPLQMMNNSKRLERIVSRNRRITSSYEYSLYSCVRCVAFVFINNCRHSKSNKTNNTKHNRASRDSKAFTISFDCLFRQIIVSHQRVNPFPTKAK